MSTKYMVIQIIGFMDGTTVNLPMDLFAEEKDAERKCKDLMSRAQHVANWPVSRPKPGGGWMVAGKWMDTIAENLGIAQVGYRVAKVHEAGLVEEVAPSLIIKP
ncbi:MAG: hypothetical protein NW202_13390 [Nitrospira sp.]|nr:hypothetical protein [Nitrospira sp.]